MAAMASLGLSTTMAKVMANICNVKGTGPRGTVTHADTAMMAMVRPTKATERVRAEALVFVRAVSMVISPFDEGDTTGRRALQTPESPLNGQREAI